MLKYIYEGQIIQNCQQRFPFGVYCGAKMKKLFKKDNLANEVYSHFLIQLDITKSEIKEVLKLQEKILGKKIRMIIEIEE